ncbi:MAG: RNA methyltransferase [Pseudomonadota bacterium]|nr:RNA methyltransferase [Pseudomonadota bacterium]
MSIPSIILVETSHPGNIGAAARAMKNMCLQNLILVSPQCDHLCSEAMARASGATEILEQAIVFDQLSDAIARFKHTIALSHRTRTIPINYYTSQLFFDKYNIDETFAFIFGNEQSGLTNDQLDLCQIQLTIDANPVHPSLNVASTVQIIAYECYKQTIKPMMDNHSISTEPLPTSDEMFHFQNHLATTLESLDVLIPNNKTHTLRRLNRLFTRAYPSKKDIALLRGILTAIDKK